MANPTIPAGLFKLVDDFCSSDQISDLLRTAQGTTGVRISAPNKKALIEDNLQTAILNHAIPLERIYNLIREAEENGSQHIFYFKHANVGVDYSNLEAIGQKLWGDGWPNKMKFPRVDLLEGQFVFSDFRAWNPGLKPRDWVLKIYGHEFVDRPTEHVEEIDQYRYKREFVREERRIVIVVRWNDPDILEIRLPQTESKKRIKAWLAKAWVMIAAACDPDQFVKWELRRLRVQLINAQEQNKAVYSCSNTRVVDQDMNVASFETHEPQGNLFSSKDVADSVQRLLSRGDCKTLRVTWFEGKNGVPSRDLTTLIGVSETNEIVLTGHCTSKDVEYVTEQLRKFGGRKARA